MAGTRIFDADNIDASNSAGLITVNLTRVFRKGDTPNSTVMDKSINLPIGEMELSPEHLIQILGVLAEYWKVADTEGDDH